MIIRLKSDGIVIDIINHLRETFNMLNLVDYYVKEVIDKQNLDSEINKELHNKMPLHYLSSKVILVCKKQYADAPMVTPKLSKIFPYESSYEKLTKKRSSQECTRKNKAPVIELISVS